MCILLGCFIHIYSCEVDSSSASWLPSCLRHSPDLSAMAPLARIKSSLTRMPVGVVAGALSARMSLVSLPMMRTAATAVLPKCCTSSSLPLSPPLPVHYPPYASPLCIGRRHYHTTPHSAPAQPSAPDARWLSDLLARLGRCIIFGCGPTQVDRAARVLSALATEWRGLVAGSEGFLTGGRGRRGLEGHQVAWGEQDSFVRFVFLSFCSLTSLLHHGVGSFGAGSSNTGREVKVMQVKRRVFNGSLDWHKTSRAGATLHSKTPSNLLKAIER